MRIRNAARFTSPRNVSLIGDDRGRWADIRTRRATGGGFLARATKAALAVILAAGLLPLVPGAPVVEEAEALSGSTDYSSIFTIANRNGTPGYISGSTLVAASSMKPSDYAVVGEGQCRSSAFFISKKSMPLDMSWMIEATVNFRNLTYASGYANVGMNAMLGFTTGNNSNALNGVLASINRTATSSSIENFLAIKDMKNSAGSNRLSTKQVIADRSTWSVRFVYTPSDQTLQLQTLWPSYTLSLPNVKSELGGANSAYLCFIGTIGGNGKTTLVPRQQVDIEFESVTLPHLSPAIRSVSLYDEDGNAIGPNDFVSNGSKVRVVCRLYNNDNNSKDERYPIHLKKVDSMVSGFSPYSDASHRTKVNGAVVSASITDEAGIPATLQGTSNASDSTKDTVIEYWGTVNRSAGAAASVGHQIVEDVFGGTSGAVKTTLLNELPLVPGDGTGSGEAGSDYHYTRLPAPNVNGWNNSPVTVTFYPGTYDEMELAPSGQASVTLTEASPSWVQSADTAGVSLAAQAKNTSTGAMSAQKAGKVKIDSEAPRLSATGRALGAYSADDSPTDASKVSSGMWRLHRTGASGVVSDATVYRTFATTGAAGDLAGASQTESLGELPNGYWVVEDAAGNTSSPAVKVSATEPPAVGRPDLDDPDGPTPAGPPYDPATDPVPPPRQRPRTTRACATR